VIDTSKNYTVYREASLFDGTDFEANYVGLKGSAIYVRDLSQVIINNCVIEYNGPLFVTVELTISPYYVLFSSNSTLYYDETKLCFDEFDYIQKCSTIDIYIDYPQVSGAVAVEFCTDIDCMYNDTVQNLYITNTTFRQNDAGPLMSII
jgi:hypothetical protein